MDNTRYSSVRFSSSATSHRNFLTAEVSLCEVCISNSLSTVSKTFQSRGTASTLLVQCIINPPKFITQAPPTGVADIKLPASVDPQPRRHHNLDDPASWYSFFRFAMASWQCNSHPQSEALVSDGSARVLGSVTYGISR